MQQLDHRDPGASRAPTFIPRLRLCLTRWLATLGERVVPADLGVPDDHAVVRARAPRR